MHKGPLSRAYFKHRYSVIGPLIFMRRADGAVEIWNDPDFNAGLSEKATRLAIVPAGAWASTVSTLCDEGETALTWNLALVLHTRNAWDSKADEHDAGDKIE
jgi:hypothetical protein